MVERVLPDASYVEITKRKKEVREDLKAALYLFEEKLIVSSISGCFEVGEPTVLDANVSDMTLGETICDHLLQFDPNTPRRSQPYKLTDWAAYRVSGAPSVKSFESHCWMVDLSTVGDNSVVVRAQPRGRALRCAQSLRDQELI